MFVRQITILHFKGFDSTEIVPDSHLNVFIGNNGTGKSTLLKALVISLSWLLARVRSSNGKGDSIAEDDIRTGTQYAMLQCGLDTGDGWSLFRAKRAFSNEERLRSDLSSLAPLAQTIQQQIEHNGSIPVIVHYPVTRSVIDIPLRIRQHHQFSTLSAYEDALYKGTANFRLFFEWFRQREDLENELSVAAMRNGQEPQSDVQLLAVRRALTSFFPQFTNMRVRRQPLRMTIEKEGQELKIDQLSDGEKCFIALVADLSRRLAIANPAMGNPLEGDGIVMIDEIELHLHPVWQATVIDKLRSVFPNCQFFITTHSPSVVNHVPTNCLYLLDNGADGNAPISIVRPSIGYGQTSESVYTNLMGLPSSRPAEVDGLFRQAYAKIRDNQFDEARQIVADLRNRLADDPELLKIEGLIRRKELIGK